MNLSHDEERRIRSYLLGELAQEDARQLDDRLLRDDRLAEQVGLVEDELIEDYVHGDLSAHERERLEKLFFTTPRRRRRLEIVRGLRERALVVVNAESPKEEEHVSSVLAGAGGTSATVSARRDAWFGSRWKMAAVVAFVALAGAGIWYAVFHQPPEARGLAALDKAYRRQRPLEARVVGLTYAPFVAERGGEAEEVDYRARDHSRSLLLGAAEDNPSASTLSALGRFYLTQREFDKAILQFEEALKSSPDDPQLHADLGAALLEQAKLLRDRGEDGKVMAKLGESQGHLNTALKLNPSLLEAAFNRALGLEEMMLPEQAKAAWQSYLALDAQSGWSKEAQRHLQDISSRHRAPPTPAQLLESFVAAFRARDEARAWQILSGSREIITRKMIPPQLAHEYAARSLDGQEALARESLSALSFAGELDRRMGGDPYTAELAAYYTNTNAPQLRLLFEAAKNLHSGYELCLDTKYEEAARSFEVARASFEQAGNVWEARLADYWIAYCLSQPGRVRESNAILDTLVPFCERRGYKWLLAHATGWLAANYTALHEHSTAIKYYRHSLSLAEDISDTYLMQRAFMGLGDSFTRLRQPEASLRYHYRSLALAARSGATPRQSWRNFTYSGGSLFAFKHYDAAVAYLKEALLLATTEFNDPSLVYLQHLNLGLVYSKLRRFEEAITEVEIGLRAASSGRDSKSSLKPIANAKLRQGDVWREAGDCEKAVAHYDQAISLYEEMELDLYRYAAYKGRLLCARARGDATAVGRDLPLILRLFEEHRAQIREEMNRNSFFDVEQEVYDIAVEYEYERENYRVALDHAESARARSLLDAVQSGTRVEMTEAGPEVTLERVSTPDGLESVRQLMPHRLRVLMYTVLPTKLILWSISRDSQEQFTVDHKDVLADALDADVDAYVRALTTVRSGPARPAAALGVKLFESLLGPVANTIKPGDVVCIIPDKFLNRLPFAALISPEGGMYLVELTPIFYAPSLNVLSHCLKVGLENAASAPGTLLSIGNPTFDIRAHPDLQPLWAAEREAREIAALYQRPVWLPGPKASKARVLRYMDSAEVVHFAGHYVVDESSPLLSKMLLAGGLGEHDSQEQDPDLSVFEIVRRRLGRTRLVVLSACQTGLDRYYAGEGPVGLARAFIEAGVPQVVASQWPVDSGATSELMINFHRYKHSGVGTPEALRKAQAEMLAGPDETRRLPYYWAAFLCAGGCAEY